MKIKVVPEVGDKFVCGHDRLYVKKCSTTGCVASSALHPHEEVVLNFGNTTWDWEPNFTSPTKIVATALYESGLEQKAEYLFH